MSCDGARAARRRPGGGIPPALWLVAAAAVLAGLLQLNAVQRPVAGLRVAIEGEFVLEDATARTRIWSTEGQREYEQGRITLGPLPGAGTIWFQVSGHPLAPGNRVYFENRDTGETFTPAFFPPDAFFRAPIRFLPPPAWRDAAIVLHVVDASPEPATWIAVSAPVTIPAWAAWFGGAPSRVCAFLFVGILLALVALAADMVVRRCRLAGGALRLSAALTVVAVLGYLAFWSFFAAPRFGAGFTALVLAGATAAALWPVRGGSTGATRGPALHDRDWSVPALLMLTIGTFDVAALHRYGGEAPMAAIAQYRFVANMPADNQLPHDFARALESGGDPRDYAGSGWRSSDRPPLQTGWQLLLARPAVYLRAGYNAAVQSAGVWFQLLWIPALWAWLRRSGERRRTTALIIVAVAASGFLFFHSVYVWPKLGCAALGLTAFTCWFVAGRDGESENARGRELLLGAAAAGLALLAHGGAAFALIALAPLLAARWWRTRRSARREPRPAEPDRAPADEPRHAAAIVGAALVLSALVLPWIAYQKFYDPPGDRLIKWHLGGVTEVDETRGALATLVDAYRRRSLGELTRTRAENVRAVVAGPWRALFGFDFSSPETRRHQEWFHTFFALGWWNLGILVAAAAAAGSAARRSANAIAAGLVLPLAWALLTMAGWIALLFDPGTAFIHHGSFAPLLVLLGVAALALWRLHPLAFGAVMVVQLASFALIWLPRPTHWAEVPASAAAMAIMVVAAVGAGLVVWRADRHEP